MQLTPAALSAIFLNFNLQFQGAYDSTPTFYQKIANEIPSTTRETHYGWIGRIPKMREWLGERVINNVAAREYTVKNKTWEDTIALKREDILDDQVGLYGPAVTMLGEQAKTWPDQILTDLLATGETATSFDGQPFFNGNHPTDPDNGASAVQSNLLTGSALSADTYQTARAQMMAFKGEDGKPLGVMPDLLMVPPALEKVGRQILNGDMIATAIDIGGGNKGAAMQTNVLKGSADLLVNPYLAGKDTEWYLLDTKKAIKPFVFQLREPPTFTYLTQPTDENVFFRKEFISGVMARGNVGFSLWFLALKGKA